MPDAAGAATPSGGTLASSDLGPLIGLRMSPSRVLLRPGPAWAVLAGALASGAALWRGGALLQLVGAIILADSAWGAVWAPVAGMSHPQTRERMAAPSGDSSWFLPYMDPAGPAARLRRMLPDGTWREVLAGVVLTAGLSALLGVQAVVISLVALLVGFSSLFLTHWRGQAGLFCALMNVGLPWALGLTVIRGGLEGTESRLAAGIALGLAFTVLDWGAHRVRDAEANRGRGIWLGELLVLAVLVLFRLPWTGAVVSVLFLPPSWLSLRSRVPGPRQASSPMAAFLTCCGPWWWAALMLSALAMR